MALDGGGGGGGLIGSSNSFVGPQDAIELVGDHFLCYTGNVSIDGNDSDIPMANFTTGNYYCVGVISLEGDFGGIGNSKIGLSVKLNNSVIVDTNTSFAGDHTIFDAPLPIVIPAYTKVEVFAAQNTGGALDFQLMMTGRTYRTK
jgi:hypothetical protein